MEVFDAISRRHSYRGPFKEAALPREDLEKIVQAGIQAPSGCNAQSTRFVIVDDESIVGSITNMHPSNKAMQTAKAFVACIVDKSPEAVYEGKSFQVEDCSAAVENMLLAVTALGYATVWIDGWLRSEGRCDMIAEMIGLPEGKAVRILLPLGIPEEEWDQKEKLPFNERAWYNSYGS
jgi:nitroreductase